MAIKTNYWKKQKILIKEKEEKTIEEMFFLINLIILNVHLNYSKPKADTFIYQTCLSLWQSYISTHASHSMQHTSELVGSGSNPTKKTSTWIQQNINLVG